MKKIVVVSDSFKGTIESLEICQIAKDVVAEFFPQCDRLQKHIARYCEIH